MGHIKALVDAYIDAEDITKERLVNMLGMSRSAFYAKISGLAPWNLDEVVALSDLLGITVDEFAKHAVRRR